MLFFCSIVLKCCYTSFRHHIAVMRPWCAPVMSPLARSCFYHFSTQLKLRTEDELLKLFVWGIRAHFLFGGRAHIIRLSEIKHLKRQSLLKFHFSHLAQRSTQMKTGAAWFRVYFHALKANITQCQINMMSCTFRNKTQASHKNQRTLSDTETDMFNHCVVFKLVPILIVFIWHSCVCVCETQTQRMITDSFVLCNVSGSVKNCRRLVSLQHGESLRRCSSSDASGQLDGCLNGGQVLDVMGHQQGPILQILSSEDKLQVVTLKQK